MNAVKDGVEMTRACVDLGRPGSYYQEREGWQQMELPGGLRKVRSSES